MQILLGISASSRPGSSFESIATATPSGVSTVTFSNIPQTYKHLQLRIISKDTSSNTGGSSSVFIRFNGSTETLYSRHYLWGDGSSIDTYGENSTSNNGAGLFSTIMPGSGSGVENMFGVGIVDIYDYTSTTKGKTFRMFGGQSTNSTGGTQDAVYVVSGAYFGPVALTSLVLYNQGSQNYASGTQFALYGIKG